MMANGNLKHKLETTLEASIIKYSTVIQTENPMIYMNYLIEGLILPELDLYGED